MCWVMPPASVSTTEGWRIASSSGVLPGSTGPMIVTTGGGGAGARRRVPAIASLAPLLARACGAGVDHDAALAAARDGAVAGAQRAVGLVRGLVGHGVTGQCRGAAAPGRCSPSAAVCG